MKKIIKLLKNILLKIQKSILGSAAGLTAPGGLLIYSTCSIEREENAEQIAVFLEKHQDFTLISQRQLLPDLEIDGAFAAVMKRNEK